MSISYPCPDMLKRNDKIKSTSPSNSGDAMKRVVRGQMAKIN